MFGRRSQRDLEDEIRAHLELEAARLRAQGMNAHDAERAARRNFGNVGVAEDRFYHAQRFASAQDAMRDIRYALRALRRQPGFLVTSVGTLAIAIVVPEASLERAVDAAAPRRLNRVPHFVKSTESMAGLERAVEASDLRQAFTAPAGRRTSPLPADRRYGSVPPLDAPLPVQ